MDDRYTLYIRPDKRDRVAPNEKSKDILRYIDFLRVWYRVPITTYVDHSTIPYFKVDISSECYDIRMYLNNDADGTVDLSIPGVGIVYTVPSAVVFRFLLRFHELRCPDDITRFLRP